MENFTSSLHNKKVLILNHVNFTILYKNDIFSSEILHVLDMEHNVVFPIGQSLHAIIRQYYQ